MILSLSYLILSSAHASWPKPQRVIGQESGIAKVMEDQGAVSSVNIEM